MPNREALAVVQAAVSLSRTHPHAPPLAVLDPVMNGRVDQLFDFADPNTVNDCLATPGAPFGRIVAASFDVPKMPNEWAAFTGSAAESGLRDACLNIWRIHVVPRFAARYEVLITGLP